MKGYKFRLISTERLIRQIKENIEKIRQTRKYIEYAADSIIDLFGKIKKLNIEISKLDVEEKSLKHDSYKTKDLGKEEKRNESNKILEVGLSDFIFKVDFLLNDIKVIYIDGLTLLYRKYKELARFKADDKQVANKIGLLRERIKFIAMEIYERDQAQEELVITEDVFEKRKTSILKEMRNEILEIERLEREMEHPCFRHLKKIGREIEDIQDIEFDVAVLIPKLEEIIPKIDSETYLLDDITERKVNKEILLVKKKIEKIKNFINEQARLLFEEVKVV